MRAVVHRRFGPPEVLRFEDVETPAVTPGKVLVRVRAAAINALDWYLLTGTPYPMRLTGGLGKKGRIPCVDFAGIVEAVGDGVTSVRPGDEVFGAGENSAGALAELIRVAEHRVAKKPVKATWEQAAAIPVAGLTAIQGLRDKANVGAGTNLLINGASGGVGTFAVQVAKALGARVTAVCRTKHVDLARTLGADEVIDTDREDFTRRDERWDVMFDVAGGKSWRAYCRVLRPGAICVLAGGPRREPLLGPLGHLLAMSFASIGGSRKVVPFMSRMDHGDLETLAAWIEAGRLRPAVDRVFEWAQAAEAFRHFDQGHPSGKVVIRI